MIVASELGLSISNERNSPSSDMQCLEMFGRQQWHDEACDQVADESVRRRVVGRHYVEAGGGIRERHWKVALDFARSLSPRLQGLALLGYDLASCVVMLLSPAGTNEELFLIIIPPFYYAQIPLGPTRDRSVAVR